MKENHSSQNAQESGTSSFTRLRSKLSFERMVEMGAKMGMENPLFLCHERAAKATTVINGKEYINFSTYDYLDLNTHPEITEAATEAAKVFGSSAGASRLVGDGNWKRKLVEMRKRLHLEDLVDMPGFVPNDRIRTFMEEHDMLVVPSVVHTNGDRDGIPNVIMEALSCGMPVVATDVCGVGEVIRNGETGYLIPQRDPAALADAIRRMLSDREAALRMAQTGRELVFRMFDTETNIAALQDLYCRQYTQWRTTHGPNV